MTSAAFAKLGTRASTLASNRPNTTKHRHRSRGGHLKIIAIPGEDHDDFTCRNKRKVRRRLVLGLWIIRQKEVDGWYHSEESNEEKGGKKESHQEEVNQERLHLKGRQKVESESCEESQPHKEEGCIEESFDKEANSQEVHQVGKAFRQEEVASLSLRPSSRKCLLHIARSI